MKLLKLCTQLIENIGDSVNYLRNDNSPKNFFLKKIVGKK